MLASFATKNQQQPQPQPRSSFAPLASQAPQTATSVTMPTRSAHPSSISESAISRVIHQLTAPTRLAQQGDSSDILSALYASFDLTPVSDLSIALQSPMGSVLREVQTSARDIITQLATLVTVYKGIQQDTTQLQQPQQPQQQQQQQQQSLQQPLLQGARLQQRLSRTTAQPPAPVPTQRDFSSATQPGVGIMGPVFSPFQQPMSHQALSASTQFHQPTSDHHDSLARFFQSLTTPRLFTDDANGRPADYNEHGRGNAH